MSNKTMTLAAVLLAGGIGTASAQGQMQGQGPAQGPTTTPPYNQQVTTTVPLGPHIDKPKVNPSAAGEITGWKNPSPQDKANGDAGEHSGSVGTNANTHPWTSLEAGGEPRREGMTQPSGVYPTPNSTMNRESGR